MSRTRHPSLVLLAAALIAGAVACLGQEPTGPTGPPINRLVWNCAGRIDWRLQSTPLWFSMGHANRVLAIVPEGLVEHDGAVQHTRDGSGAIHAVSFEVYDVLAFDKTTGLPVTTKLLERRTVSADDKREKRLERWPFGSEQGYDWEMSLLPPLQVQFLLRMFLHDSPQLWHTLMIHCETVIKPLPPALCEPDKATSAFTDFRTHILVMQLLHDPDLSIESTYLEPDDPPSTWWIAKEEVPAPWALGRTELQFVVGSFVAGMGDEPPAFQVLSAAAKAAPAAVVEKPVHRPEVSTDGADRLDTHVDAELELDIPGGH